MDISLFVAQSRLSNGFGLKEDKYITYITWIKHRLLFIPKKGTGEEFEISYFNIKLYYHASATAAIS